jgi:tRNA-Thr(GGU) m(6)t(6)A37 methyltransferase TsaA
MPPIWRRIFLKEKEKADVSDSYSLKPIGVVRSELKRLEDAPMQGVEGAPEAWLEIFPEYRDALEGITPGWELIILTWFHLSSREVLQVHPRGDPNRPIRGVFSTRAPARPNPIALHSVKVLEVDMQRGLKVYPLEAIDGTPVIDIKSA